LLPDAFCGGNKGARLFKKTLGKLKNKIKNLIKVTSKNLLIIKKWKITQILAIPYLTKLQGKLLKPKL